MLNLLIEKFRLASQRSSVRAIAAGAILSLGALFCPSDAHSDLGVAQKLETAFIFQFTNYIEWPETGDGPFVISVLGDDGLLPYLEELAKKKNVKGKDIQVLFARDISQLKKSKIVVVTTNDEDLLQQAAKKSRGVLIVSHSEGFAEKGAMINFFEEAGHLKFEINRQALEDQKLVVSSQLLKLARIVE